jgi:uncharacterized protein (DUF1015 family)
MWSSATERVAELSPFSGLRYDLSRTGSLESLLAPPYDVLSDEQVAEHAARSPYNIVHLTRPKGDYAAAGKLLQTWMREGSLVQDAPALYLHEVRFEDRVRRDLIAALRLRPYEDGVVLPHERTHMGPKEDRLALLRATSASLEPLWFLYDGAGTNISPVLAEAFGRPADREFKFGEEEHRLWVLEEAGRQLELVQAFRDTRLLIADGHHRYETALAYANEMGGPPDAPHRFTMALLTEVADPGLEVLPTHRVLKAGVEITGGIPAASLDETLAAIEGAVAAGTYRGGRFQVLPLEGEVAVVELHRQVIDNILGGREAEDLLLYTRDASEAVRWVDEGRGVAAFFLGRPDLHAVLKLAGEGKTMPQKSTYFHPKMPSGVVIQPFRAGRNL